MEYLALSENGISVPSSSPVVTAENDRETGMKKLEQDLAPVMDFSTCPTASKTLIAQVNRMVDAGMVNLCIYGIFLIHLNGESTKEQREKFWRKFDRTAREEAGTGTIADYSISNSIFYYSALLSMKMAKELEGDEAVLKIVLQSGERVHQALISSQ